MAGESLKRDLRRIDERVRVVETLVLRAWCVLVGAVLALGVLLPFGHSTVDEEPVASSVITMPANLLAEYEGEGGDERRLVLLTVAGFVGLAAVVVGMIVTLMLFWGRQGGDGLLKFSRVLLVLAAIGTAVVLLFTVFFINEDEGGSAGFGGLVLLAGVLGYATLLRPPLTALWRLPAMADRPPVITRGNPRP